MSSQILESVTLRWCESDTSREAFACTVSRFKDTLPDSVSDVSHCCNDFTPSFIHFVSVHLSTCLSPWQTYIRDIMSWTVYLLRNSRDIIRFISSIFHSPVSPLLSFSTGLLFAISLFFATCCINCMMQLSRFLIFVPWSAPGKIFIFILILILQWHYSPVKTFASFMEFSQLFMFLILQVLISVCAHSSAICFFFRPLTRLSWVILLNTWLSYLTRYKLSKFLYIALIFKCNAQDLSLLLLNMSIYHLFSLGVLREKWRDFNCHLSTIKHNFYVLLTVHPNTECFKKSFTNLKAYRNLYRGHTQRFELSKCSKTHRVWPRIVMVQCDFHW